MTSLLARLASDMNAMSPARGPAGQTRQRTRAGGCAKLFCRAGRRGARRPGGIATSSELRSEYILMLGKVQLERGGRFTLCHSERSEESVLLARGRTLRCAQSDKVSAGPTRKSLLAPPECQAHLNHALEPVCKGGRPPGMRAMGALDRGQMVRHTACWQPYGPPVPHSGSFTNRL